MESDILRQHSLALSPWPSKIFKSHTLTNPKQYSNIVSSELSVTTSLLRIRNTVWPLYGVTPGFLTKQPVLWETLKNLIFLINQIQTAVKKIITTIFSKTSKPCYMTISKLCHLKRLYRTETSAKWYKVWGQSTLIKKEEIIYECPVYKYVVNLKGRICISEVYQPKRYELHPLDNIV